MGDDRVSNVRRLRDRGFDINPIRRAVKSDASSTGVEKQVLGEYNKTVKEAIRNWTGVGYISIRHGKDPVHERILENYVQGHSYKDTIYRAFDSYSIDGFEKGAIIKQAGHSSKSAIGMDAVLSSWSKSKNVAKGFAGNSDAPYHVMLTMTGGTNVGAYIADDSHYKSEKEILVSGKSKQRIKSVKKNGKWLYLTVEEVLDV